MRVLITGGTGTLGRELVQAATDAGNTVRILSRRPRPKDQNSNIEWAQADLASGEAVAKAVSEVDAVMHAATSPGFGAGKVDVEGTRRLVRASEKAGVEHFVYPSIVGIDDIPFSYYRHKRNAERIIEKGGVPHSILRATQFHALVNTIISAAMRVPFAALLPTDFQVQSVAASEVAMRLHELLEGGARGRLPNFGGPEVSRLGESARAWMKAKQWQKRLLHLPVPGKTARAFRDGKNTDPDRKVGRVTWAEWLRTSRVQSDIPKSLPKTARH